MPYSPLIHNSAFLHVFGEEEGLPLLESLINAHFEAVGLPLVHKLQLQPRDVAPEHQGEKLAILDMLPARRHRLSLPPPSVSVRQ